jgi:hypothetical protein
VWAQCTGMLMAGRVESTGNLPEQFGGCPPDQGHPNISLYVAIDS